MQNLRGNVSLPLRNGRQMTAELKSQPESAGQLVRNIASATGIGLKPVRGDLGILYESKCRIFVFLFDRKLE